MAGTPTPVNDNVSAVTAPSLRRRAVPAAVNAVSFGLADFVHSPRRRWTVRLILHGSALAWSAPSMKRSVPQVRAAWQRISPGQADGQTRRIALAFASSAVVFTGLGGWLWYRLLVRCAGVLAGRGVHFPRLIVGVASELFALTLSAKLRRTRVTRARSTATSTGIGSADTESTP